MAAYGFPIKTMTESQCVKDEEGVGIKKGRKANSQARTKEFGAKIWWFREKLLSLHHLCVTIKFEIMENNIQKEDLLALVKSKIYTIRGQKVMLDFDLAAMYGVKTGRLNEQVKRNIERFPEDFMFQLTKGELEILRSQIVISKMPDNQVDENWKSQNATSNLSENQYDSVLISQNATSKPLERRGGTQKRPYAFTENGVAMLSSVLRSQGRR